MEWLINRRRMMYNKALPPVYIAFEDSKIWEYCCVHWGDYNETVITDNGDDTVNIVTKFKSMKNLTVKKSIVISEQNNVDNSQGTYTAGTTKEPVGITIKQCAAVITFPATAGDLKSGKMPGLTSFNEFKYFTNIRATSYALNLFNGQRSLTSLECPPINWGSSTYVNGWFRDCSALKHLVLPKTQQYRNYCFSYCGAEELDFSENTTFIEDFPRGNSNLKVVVCRTTTPPTMTAGQANAWPAKLEHIYVPAESVDLYKAAKVWSTKADLITSIEGSDYE